MHACLAACACCLPVWDHGVVGPRFIVACSNGRLLQRSRFGEELSPKQFAAPDSLGSALSAFIGGDELGDSEFGAVSATCVEYCPTSPGLFLAGFSDGKLG